MNRRFLPALAVAVMGMIPTMAMASAAAWAPDMKSLSDDDLALVSGEGIAFAALDFRLQMASTSYFEQMGTNGGGGGFRRGDLRWYGLTLSNGVDTSGFTHWDNAACTPLAGNESLSCPQANNGVARLAAYDNPYVFRAYDYLGQTVDTASDGTTGSAAVSRTVLELLSPSNSDVFRWAFWGETESGKELAAGAAGKGMLQNQAIILGKPSSPTQKTVMAAGCTADNCTPGNGSLPGTTATPRYGSVLRLYPVANTNDPTLGLFYHHRLSGDFRFSVNQDNASAASGVGIPVRYTTTEGLYFKGVSTYMPLGQLHYQSIIFDSFGSGTTEGNFTIEVTRPPTNGTASDDDAYKDFYSVSTCPTATEDPYYGADCGYQRDSQAYDPDGPDLLGGIDKSATTPARPARYWETHGYAIWGTLGTANDDKGGTEATRATDTTDGIYFRGVENFTSIADRPNPDEEDAKPKRVYGPDTGLFSDYSGYTKDGKSVASVNLGDSFIEGLLIQHLKITSCGAGSGDACP